MAGGSSTADPALAFSAGGLLSVMNADGSNRTSLGIGGVDHTSWSPDLDGDPSNGYPGTLAIEVAAGVIRLDQLGGLTDPPPGRFTPRRSAL